MTNTPEYTEKKKTSLKKKIFFAAGLTLLVLATLLAIIINPLLKTAMPLEYTDIVEKYAAEYELDEALVFAVIKTESNFISDALSHANAHGLMQITEETFVWLQTKTGEKHELEILFDPDINIKYGCLFLSMLIDEFEVIDTALAAYNAGRGAANKWLQDNELSDDGINLKHIPYPETRHYVHKVNNALEWYERIYDFNDN